MNVMTRMSDELMKTHEAKEIIELYHANYVERGLGAERYFVNKTHCF